MNQKNAKYLTVKLTKSLIARLQSHKDCARGLGLRKIRSVATVLDTPANRGMINKIAYMLEVKGM